MKTSLEDEGEEFGEVQKNLTSVEVLQNNCTDLLEAAKRSGKPKYRCENEVKRVIEIAGGFKKYCACLVGDDAKSNEAVIDALAHTMNTRDAIPEVAGHQLWSLDLDRIFRRNLDGEEMQKEITATLKAAHEETAIIFIDDINRMIKGTRTRVYNVIHEAIKNGQLLCLGAISREDYDEHIGSSPVMRRHFQRIDVQVIRHAIPAVMGLSYTESVKYLSTSSARAMTYDSRETSLTSACNADEASRYISDSEKIEEGIQDDNISEFGESHTSEPAYQH